MGMNPTESSLLPAVRHHPGVCFTTASRRGALLCARRWLPTERLLITCHLLQCALCPIVVRFQLSDSGDGNLNAGDSGDSNLEAGDSGDSKSEADDGHAPTAAPYDQR